MGIFKNRKKNSSSAIKRFDEPTVNNQNIQMREKPNIYRPQKFSEFFNLFD